MTAVGNVMRAFALLTITILTATAVRLGDNADDASAPADAHKAQAKQHDVEDGHKKVKHKDQDAKTAHKKAVSHDAKAAHKKANLTRSGRCYIFKRMGIFESCIEENRGFISGFFSSSKLDSSHKAFEEGGWNVGPVENKDCKDMGFSCKEDDLKKKRREELENMDHSSSHKDKDNPVEGLEMYKRCDNERKQSWSNWWNGKDDSHGHGDHDRDHDRDRDRDHHDRDHDRDKRDEHEFDKELEDKSDKSLFGQLFR